MKIQFAVVDCLNVKMIGLVPVNIPKEVNRFDTYEEAEEEIASRLKDDSSEQEYKIEKRWRSDE